MVLTVRFDNFESMRISLFLTILMIAGTGFSQNIFEQQIPKPKRYTPEEVIDSIHGIEIYEKLNFRLHWDSVRNCKGYACNGLVQDYYVSGAILHKGIYHEGQLTGYTNYYPNGKIERYFRIIDDFRSEMNLYYDDGVIKSRHKYKDGTPILWEDHYPNGQKSYFMHMDDGHEYYISKKHWLEDGHLLAEMVLIDKKKMLFKQNEYYKTGKSKMKGQLIYNHKMYSYYKTGKWNYYDENGKLIKQEIYDHGELVKEVTAD